MSNRQPVETKVGEAAIVRSIVGERTIYTFFDCDDRSTANPQIVFQDKAL